jgi:hypothetical protein
LSLVGLVGGVCVFSVPMTSEETREALKFTRMCKCLGRVFKHGRSIAGTCWDMFLEMEDGLYSTEYQDVPGDIASLTENLMMNWTFYWFSRQE